MIHHLKQTISIFCILILSIGLLSCKSTVEGETTRWESNAQKIAQLKRQYPLFSTAIDKQYAMAEQQWIEAQKVSGEEEKISAMASANRQVSSSFIDVLSDMDDQKRKLRNLQDKLRNLRGSEEVSYRASRSISECSSALSLIDITLSRGAQTPNEAESILQVLNQSVENSITHSDDVIRYAKDLERQKNKEQQEKEQQTKADTPSETSTETSESSTTEAGASITCDYCGTANSAGSGTCSGCKAPL